MKNTYPEKNVHTSKMTYLSYSWCQCSPVIQENKTVYLKKISRSVLQDFSLRFIVFSTESHTAQGFVGSCFFNAIFGTSDLKNKSQNFDYSFYFIRCKIVFTCHENAELALKGINTLNQYYLVIFQKHFCWILMIYVKNKYSEIYIFLLNI